MRVVLVGATGVVGGELLKLLERRKFPVTHLRLLASKRSAGRTISFRSQKVPVESLPSNRAGIGKIESDLVFLSTSEQVARSVGPVFAKSGAWVVDDSSAFRSDPAIPLVIPEVNGDLLGSRTGSKIIAGPNCSAAQLCVALWPIHRVSKIKSIHIASYQSVSGAGQAAVMELRRQTFSWVRGRSAPKPVALPQPIAFNLFPHIGMFNGEGYSEEETKIAAETRKIFHSPGLQISATCVRVPVPRGHAQAVWIETEKRLSPDRARDILKKAPGVKVLDIPQRGLYPMPTVVAGQWPVYVGRIRRDTASSSGLLLWIAADNLLKGAALNSVQIAELLIRKGLL